MTTTGFIIRVLLVLVGLWIYVEMARFPGRKARERGHPQATSRSHRNVISAPSRAPSGRCFQDCSLWGTGFKRTGMS